MSKNTSDRTKSGTGAEVLPIDDATEKLQTENIRLRALLVDINKENEDLKTRARDGINAIQSELSRTNEREGAHIAALRALSGHVENAALNQQRFDAIAKDFENFHNDVRAINEQLTRIGKRLDELVAEQMRKEVLG